MHLPQFKVKLSDGVEVLVSSNNIPGRSEGKGEIWVFGGDLTQKVYFHPEYHDLFWAGLRRGDQEAIALLEQLMEYIPDGE